MLTGEMLRRSAERFPSKAAVIWDGRTTSFAALDAAANQFANALISRGLGKGAHVAILCRNRTEYVTAFFGAARSGAVLVNVSVLYPEDELAYVLEKSDAQALIFESAFAEKVMAVAGKLSKLRHLIVVGDEQQPGATAFHIFFTDQPTTPPNPAIDDKDPFCMTYTGGTTGRPKGVLANHRSRAITAHTVVVESGIDEDDVVAVVTPLFHVAALNIMLQPAVLVGATTVLLSKWDVRRFAELVRDQKVSATFMVPTQVIMVLTDPELRAEDYASWRKINFSGAPMPDWVQTSLMEKLPRLSATQFYGQSEMGIVAALKAKDLPAKLGSVGRRVFNADMNVVDEEGRPVAPGEVGEIVSRGENIMLEYYNEPDQTKAFWRHGWAWSGDLGRLDDDGFVSLVDRSKDMIISGGENVYPKEIEDALYSHEAVAECAVFGVPDEKWGEIPVAYVQLKPGAEAHPDALVEHCAEILARFKRPRWVKIVTEFPKTPIGKIQKNILRQPYWQDAKKDKAGPAA